MLIQHLLTERIFRTVFRNPDFTRRNVIAAEIEKVIDALTSQSFSRAEFLRQFDYFYRALEQTADTIDDFAQKQEFLNTVYERFFQGFSVKVADTHGIVYTPQPIVDFMVRSVEEILKKEFDKSLASDNVHILDPFVGTGNFMVRVMQEIPRSLLEKKYTSELHCNEVMLLPYYIASLNIEHEFYELTRQYLPFEGICLVDTFELAEHAQGSLGFMSAENSRRVKRQQESPIFVCLGNPPYNVGQLNENDNNKNRKYKELDKRVAETYARDSKASSKSKLSDVYVKAIRAASDRIKETGEGIVAFVTNNGFIDKFVFDGMRKHLAEDFSAIYHLDLKGDARTSGELRRKQGGNVFDDLIRVGVGITFFIRKKDKPEKEVAQVFIYTIDDYLKSDAKQKFLEDVKTLSNVSFNQATVDAKNNWLTEEVNDEFDDFIPLGTKEAKADKRNEVETIFKTYSLGVNTNRDVWALNFDEHTLEENIKKSIEFYNHQVYKWVNSDKQTTIDAFVQYDDKQLSWSRDLKLDLKRSNLAEFSKSKIRTSIYRPFTKKFLFFDRILNEEVYQYPKIFPDSQSETENRVICIGGYGRKGFGVLITDKIPNLNFYGDPQQSFPLYVYNEKGERRENITDWALQQFREKYDDVGIEKLDIFHYVYAVLHHSGYREKFAANLKRELPRVGFAPDFFEFVAQGEHLAELHLGYEQWREYSLERIENSAAEFSWRVEKMRLSRDRTELRYNDFLTLRGVPPETFEYKLGNRSALEWIIEQYQVTTDPRSGITNDPNSTDDPNYIVRLVGQIIDVSLNTVHRVKQISQLPLE